MHQRTASLASFVLAFLSLLLCSAVAASAAVQTTLYVAADGSDANAGTEARPFATIEKARQAVRAVNKNLAGDFVVVLRGGVYRLGHTLAFGPEDSGTNGHDVIYRAAPHEMAVLSGGRPITGWQADTGKRWKAKTDLENFRQLYVGGVRAIRAEAANWATTRMPAAGSSCAISRAAAVCRMPKPWETWATAPPRWKWPRGATFPTSSSAMSE